MVNGSLLIHGHGGEESGWLRLHRAVEPSRPGCRYDAARGYTDPKIYTPTRRHPAGLCMAGSGGGT